MGFFTCSFLYTNECTITGDTVMHLIYAAKKYDTFLLWTKCIQFLKWNLSYENVCTVLDHAILFEANEMVEECLKLIAANARKALDSPVFADLSMDGLEMILKRSPMNCEEEDLYLACKAWATNLCKREGVLSPSNANLKKVLGKLTQLIRYDVLTMGKLSEVVQEEGIVTRKDEANIENKGDLAFDKCARKRVSTITEIARFGRILNYPPWVSSLDSIAVRVSRNVYLVAIGMFLPLTKETAEGFIEIYDNLSRKSKLRQKVVLEHTPDQMVRFIELEKPLELQCDRYYIIRQTLPFRESCFGQGKIEPKNEYRVRVEFSKLDFYGNANWNGTGENIGQIYGVQILVPNIYV